MSTRDIPGVTANDPNDPRRTCIAPKGGRASSKAGRALQGRAYASSRNGAGDHKATPETSVKDTEAARWTPQDVAQLSRTSAGSNWNACAPSKPAAGSSESTTGKRTGLIGGDERSEGRELRQEASGAEREGSRRKGGPIQRRVEPAHSVSQHARLASWQMPDTDRLSGQAQHCPNPDTTPDPDLSSKIEDLWAILDDEMKLTLLYLAGEYILGLPEAFDARGLVDYARTHGLWPPDEEVLEQQRKYEEENHIQLLTSTDLLQKRDTEPDGRSSLPTMQAPQYHLAPARIRTDPRYMGPPPHLM